jgi:hypothetical protein
MSLRLKNSCAKPREFLCLFGFYSPTSEANLNENIMDIMCVGMFILVSLYEVAG